jgi:hypothetical protein
MKSGHKIGFGILNFKILFILIFNYMKFFYFFTTIFKYDMFKVRLYIFIKIKHMSQPTKYIKIQTQVD